MRISDWSSDVCSSDLTPPLAFADESFDLVYALSVFTHIPLELQRDWLDELRRVLVPGGYLLCTVTDDAATRQLQAEDKEQLERSEEHTSEIQSLMRNSYAVFCLKKKIQKEYTKI